MSGGWRTQWAFRGLLLTGVLVTIAACDKRADERAQAQAYAYPTDAPRCMHTVSPAPPAEGRLRTPEGVEVLVRTPTNYHADVAHRLLVVFAAAGMTPTASERFTGFTPPATRAGYIVAYPQHLRPSLAAIRKLARVAAAVSGNFCIDETKIFLSGHSDGGTAATAIAVQPASASQIAALAPSAAGFTGEDLAAFACPAPRPAMVWHGARDRLFPGWGRATARWWAACNQCDHTPPPMVDGCLRYAGCTQPVHYCEGDYGHMVWPADGAELTLKFFNSYQSDPKNAHESTAP